MGFINCKSKIDETLTTHGNILLYFGDVRLYIDSYLDTNLDKRLSLIDTCYLTTKFLELF